MVTIILVFNCIFPQGSSFTCITFKMQIKDIENPFNGGSPSIFSQFLNFLFFARLIPVKLSRNKSSISYKLCSCETFTFILISWGVLSMLHGTNIYFSLKKQEENEKYGDGNPIDTVVFYFHNLFIFLVFPLCPLVLSKSLTRIGKMSMANDLKWPKNGIQIMWSCCFLVIGKIVSECVYWNTVKMGQTLRFVLTFFVPFVQGVFLSFTWLLPPLIVSSLMQKFVSLCFEEKQDGNAILHAENCLKKYITMKNGFGCYFLLFYNVTQFLTIFALFLTISHGLGSAINKDVWKLINAGSHLCFSIGLILNSFGFTFTLESAFESLLAIRKDLKVQLISEKDPVTKNIMKTIIEDLKEEGPLSGKGFFNITKGTLTSMVSISITYIIILVQFKISFLQAD